MEKLVIMYLYIIFVFLYVFSWGIAEMGSEASSVSLARLFAWGWFSKCRRRCAWVVAAVCPAVCSWASVYSRIKQEYNPVPRPVWEESWWCCVWGTCSPVRGRMGSLTSCAPYTLESTGNCCFWITSYHRNKERVGEDNLASRFLRGNKKLIAYDLTSFKMQT